MMKKLKRLFRKRNSAGYTLVEVIIATALLGILVVGIMAFITPIFGILDSSDEAKKAERSVATMEHYLSKSLRSSLYIKVFTNACMGDMNGTDSPILDDEDFNEMIDFFDVDGRDEKYTLNCIAIKYVTDHNIRNSKTGDTAEKYMLYHEKYTINSGTMDSINETPIFEECFYEDIYPTFDIGYIKVEVDDDGNVIKSTVNGDVIDEDDPDTADATAESSDTSETSETAEGEPDTHILTPALTIDINVYNDEDVTNRMNMIFSGRSIIEVNNVKSLVLNKDEIYKIFEHTDISAQAGATGGKDTYIFFITRNVGTDIAGG